MTIGIAFKCRDGAVLCADTQLTIPYPYSLKYSKTKIFGFTELTSRPFFTYAGDVDFSLMCIHRIVGVLASAKKRADVESTLSREAIKIHAEYFPLYPDERLTLQLLAVFRVPDGTWRVAKVTGPRVTPVMGTVECIGVGTPVAQCIIVPLLASLNLDTREAARIGFYVLSQVKQFVEGCGGDTEMVTFRDRGGQFDYVPHLKESGLFFGEAFSAFQDALRPILLGYNAVEEDTPTFETQLREMVKKLKAFRADQIKRSKVGRLPWLRE